jgi:endonuclease/exonuclease/phosphatase family metal-dependent hydrolase
MCIGGDFNQDLQDTHYYGSRRNRRSLVAALSSAGVQCVTAGEADPVRAVSGNRCATVDHLCLDYTLQTHEVCSVGAWPIAPQPERALSDHYAVWIDLIL